MAEETGQALAPMETFKEKVKNRIAKDIGDLIPDEVLAEMAARSLEEMFFTRRESERDYGRTKVVKDSWFDEAVKKHLEPQLKQIVDDAIKEKVASIGPVIEAMMTETMPIWIARYFTAQMEKVAGYVVSENTENLGSFITDGIRNNRWGSI